MDQQVLDRNPRRPASGDLGVVRRFLVRRQNVRLMLYLMLVVCDVAAIRAAFSVGVTIRGPYWLHSGGFELGWLILPIHILVGFRGGAYAHDAVKSRLESVGRACRSFMIATALICMLILFQRTGFFISRLAFSASILLSLLFLAAFRIMSLTVFVGKDKSWMFGELLIIDDVPAPADYTGEVLDARVIGLVPDLRDHAQLSALAEVIQRYDRVVVSCATEARRSDWAQMIKCFPVTGEVLLDGGSPLGAIGIDRFRGHDTIVVVRGALSMGNQIKKRMMDIAVSGAALIFLAPLLLVVAIAIKLDSRGPVLFKQPRVGRGNRLFNVFKFRSMRNDAGDLAGSRSTARDDDRVTRVGRIIRATSIDELPQVMNVLKGDMSMVGPRPHALGSLAGDKLFWEVDSAYWRRHALKPGITGLAQVRGFRGATHEQVDLENRLQSDLEYVSGWSLWGDFKILVSTVRVVIHPRAF